MRAWQRIRDPLDAASAAPGRTGGLRPFVWSVFPKSRGCHPGGGRVRDFASRRGPSSTNGAIRIRDPGAGLGVRHRHHAARHHAPALRRSGRRAAVSGRDARRWKHPVFCTDPIRPSGAAGSPGSMTDDGCVLSAMCREGWCLGLETVADLATNLFAASPHPAVPADACLRRCAHGS